jgi:TolA-binding protein
VGAEPATLRPPASYVRRMSRALRTAEQTVSVPVGDLSDRALLLLIFNHLEGLDNKMTELTQAVADLGAAVSGVTTRLADTLSESQRTVAELQTRVDALAADDETDKQAIADGLQRLSELQGQASDAATQIEQQVAALNAIDAPETPPADNGGGDVTPPADNGGGDTPADPPVTPPADDGGGDVTPPADNGGGDTPADPGTV